MATPSVDPDGRPGTRPSTMSDSPTGRMDRLVETFPQQLREALDIGPSAPLNPSQSLPEQLVVAGMGGSGVAAPLLASLVALKKPLQLIQGYRLPDWVSPKAVVVASSHSGNTAETLAVAEQALALGCRVVVISSGGQLAAMAETHGLDRWPLPTGRPPRSCLGYSLVLLGRALAHHGLVEAFPEAEIRGMATHLEQQQEVLRGAARSLAQTLHARSGEGPAMPYLLAEERWSPVLRRWCQQLQENTKVQAFAERFPEMNHNALVAWSKPSPVLVPIILESVLDDPRNAARMAWTRERIAAGGQEVIRLKGDQQEAWNQAFAWVHLGDWLSVEWAALRGVDPMDIGIIDALKTHLKDPDASEA